MRAGRQIITWGVGDLVFINDVFPEYYEGAEPPARVPREEKWRDLVTVRLTQLLRHQTLALSWFSFWSQADNDYLLNPEVKYNLTDHLWAAVGGMIFGGEEESTQFAQLDKNDNVYLQMRYSF
ncbi:MAG TPA: hypothetical protein DDY32_09920 [Desulfobulbaceae bacterium]|nr:hypothetical protein [Desulfobulbaceae bacterium]